MAYAVPRWSTCPERIREKPELILADHRELGANCKRTFWCAFVVE